jgi:hypothetical protein
MKINLRKIIKVLKRVFNKPSKPAQLWDIQMNIREEELPAQGFIVGKHLVIKASSGPGMTRSLMMPQRLPKKNNDI